MTWPGTLTDTFRARWATRLIDSCVIERANNPTFNTTTGQYTDTPTVVYTGPCLVRPSPTPQSAEQGGQLVEHRSYAIYIPHTETGVQPDDTITITSTRDGVLNGKQVTVRNVKADTYNHVRRLDCEDNQGG